MPGLTTLGLVHTAFALVALICGSIALVRYKEISPRNRSGLFYIVTTAITAATSLGIYQHGGFGPQHILAILTLAALGVGTLGALTTLFRASSRIIQAVSYSSTILLHLIPGVTEMLTRLPPGHPVVTSYSSPILKVALLLVLVAFLAGVTLQVRWLRAIK
jgi:uncharacterized membrane protein